MVQVQAASPYDSNARSPEYDCSEGSDGCHGLIYCDIDDEGDCYDRYEGSDDGSS